MPRPLRLFCAKSCNSVLIVRLRILTLFHGNLGGGAGGEGGDPSPNFFFIWERQDPGYIAMNYGYVCNEIGMTKEMERMVVIGREPGKKKEMKKKVPIGGYFITASELQCVVASR